MPFHEFRLEGDYIELNLLLKHQGLVASGGEGKHRVADGLVMVNGVVETRKTCKVRGGDIVVFGNEEISVLPEND